jgi:hypothetical protein
MRVLFASLHYGYFRNLESVVDELARRGHDVHLTAEREDSALGGRDIVERLAARHPTVTFGMMPRRERAYFFLAAKIRLSLDYLRYLRPEYAHTPALRRRARLRTPRGLLGVLRVPGVRAAGGRRTLARLLDRIDRALPPSPAIERFVDEQRPDLAIITPLVGVVASSQVDLLRSIRARRLPAAVCVWSWDHLSSKAIIRDVPDRLFVWNDVQKREALEMHGVPPDRVVVTGAQCFDRWFDRKPSRTRAEFARHVGLPDDRPFVLWVCSALFPGSPSEAEFVMRWAAHLRASADPRLREVRILIRPHPSRAHEWDDVDWRTVPGVAFRGGNPVDDQSRADYFDSLHHSAAVVGLNTSAFIEAGIAQRPVLAILPPEFSASQEGTLHFRYLVEGGLLTTSRTLEEHEAQLATMLEGPPAEVMARQEAFVRSFVRPCGLDVAATSVMADALESLASAGPAEASRPAPLVGRIGLATLRALERVPAGRRWLLDEREVSSKKRRADEEQARGAAGVAG